MHTSIRSGATRPPHCPHCGGAHKSAHVSAKAERTEPREPPIAFLVPHCCGALLQNGTVPLGFAQVVKAEYQARHFLRPGWSTGSYHTFG